LKGQLVIGCVNLVIKVKNFLVGLSASMNFNQLCVSLALTMPLKDVGVEL